MCGLFTSVMHWINAVNHQLQETVPELGASDAGATTRGRRPVHSAGIGVATFVFCFYFFLNQICCCYLLISIVFDVPSKIYACLINGLTLDLKI